MVPVIEPDAEEFRHDAHRRSDSRLALDQGQRLKVKPLDLVQTFPPEGSASKIVNDPGKVADQAAGIKNSWFFPPKFPIT